LSGGATVLNLLAQFFYLQLLDVLTTLAFLAGGVKEVNPVIRLLIGGAGSPLAGLLAAKLIALGLAGYCWRSRRERLLARVNIFYAALVAWNLVAFLMGGAGIALRA
jgi:hypothetical protein